MMVRGWGSGVAAIKTLGGVVMMSMGKEFRWVL